MSDLIHYFAYGSNMAHKRLVERVGDCQLIGKTVLECHQLCFHKIGQDGSAKCDAYFTGDSDHRVYGVLFSIPSHQQEVLDRFEGVGRGYERKTIELEYGRVRYNAFLYYATHIDVNLRPYHWYKHHVVKGAREAGLPADYQAYIKRVMSITDPDSERSINEYAIHL